MGLDHEEADELLQDVFIRFWRATIHNESGHDLKITLYRLATVSCLAYLVKHSILSLQGLTSEELLIVVLKDHAEFDFLEIAQITSSPVNDIRNDFKTAINKLTAKDKN